MTSNPAVFSTRRELLTFLPVSTVLLCLAAAPPTPATAACCSHPPFHGSVSRSGSSAQRLSGGDYMRTRRLSGRQLWDTFISMSLRWWEIHVKQKKNVKRNTLIYIH